MARTTLNDLSAFIAVAQARSFTKAAARLGVTPSALSYAMRGLEEKLGANTLIYPVVAQLARDYPDIEIEVSSDNKLADIVAGGFDAGIRLGEQVERDMIAVRIAPDMRMAVVGSPAYFARHPRPVMPQNLTEHACIGVRLPTHGGLLPWEFEKEGHEITVRIQSKLIFNTWSMSHRAVLEGLGLGYSPEDVVAGAIADGRLTRVLDDWCEPFPGYHIYYPSRRQPSPAFKLFVDALKRQEASGI